MKKLTTISLFIFAVVVIAILVAGLLFYQNKKDTNNQTASIVSMIDKSKLSGMTLNIAEVAKHNSKDDCWIIISEKVYDITGYFGNHPGGNDTMSATCGRDATNAYNTKDPSATKIGYFDQGHSSQAHQLLNNYYLGDLGQTI